MCLIFLAYNSHPEYPLVLAANRDEFYDRPARPMDIWPEHPHILAGKDLQAGGTWLGVSKSGYFAMITNYRDMRQPTKPQAPSRGKLVLDYLTGLFEPKKYLQALHADANRYNGYNIILGTLTDPWYYSNQTNKIIRLGTGIYGLSNALLDTPWPKVRRGKERFKQILAEKNIDKEALFTMMRDSTPAADDELPDTGLDYEKEKALSSVFIRLPGYGTRNTTLLLLDKNGHVSLIERTYIPDQEAQMDREFGFSIA